MEVISNDIVDDFTDFFESQAPLETRSQSLIRSILYMSQIIRNTNNFNGKSDNLLIDSLEILTTLMDNLYLLKRFGIGSNYFSKIGENTNKIWFITLLLTIKKLISKLVKFVNIKAKLLVELKSCCIHDDGEYNDLEKIIINKYADKIQDLQNDIIADCIELFGSLNDLLFVSIELFKWKVPAWFEKVIGLIATIMSVYRLTRR